jgi:DHA1 family tetracycline resistance protein-like MFS transporter
VEKRRLANIFLVVFIDLLGFGLILPLLPYYAEKYGATATLFGLLVAVYALAQFFGAPLLGRLSDRFGRRPILIISIAGTAVSFLILALAEPVGTWIAGALNMASPNAAVLGVMFASRALAGLFGGNITVAQAYITDITDASNRARGLGMIGAAFGLGFILGPAIGGFLSGWGFAVPAYAAAGLAFINLVGVYLFLPESLTQERMAENALVDRPLMDLGAMWQAMNRPLVGPLLNIRLFFGLAAALFQTMFTLWAIDRLGLSSKSTGYILAYVGLLSVIVQAGLVGRLSKRYSDSKLIFWSSVIQVPSLLLWAFTPSVPVLMLVLIPLSFSTGVLNTIINTALTRVVSPEEVGGTLGISASLESFSRIVSPALGGWLLGNVGVWAPGVLAAIIMSGETVYAWRNLIKKPALALSIPGEQLQEIAEAIEPGN